jgi:hypothetical protein
VQLDPDRPHGGGFSWSKGEKMSEEKEKQLDPRAAEAQLYRRIDMARAQIAGAVNKTMQDAGLPTAIILELLRGIVAETSLMLERAGRGEVEREAGADKATAGKVAKGDKQ